MRSTAADKLPTERQRWMAAQRLARGHRLVRAAAFASLPPAQLRHLLATDEDFCELVEAEREQLALSRDEWFKELELDHRQAIERALADGRVSIVGHLLRLGMALPALAGSGDGRKAAGAALRRVAEAELDDERDEEELDDAEWLATLPVVEPEPAREAERRRLLLELEPRILRRVTGTASLRQVEQLKAAADPVAYEEWFARQPKPPRRPATCLTAEDAAIVEHVTRHNPPWIKGPYLGYWRPPVPAELFRPEAANDRARPDAVPAPAPATAVAPAAALRARVERLLDRTAPRRPDELDLAEAICAVRWPKWPAYAGPLDLDLLRRALADLAIDAATLTWLGSRELALACGAVKQAQGP
jgi:hypothetical protein